MKLFGLDLRNDEIVVRVGLESDMFISLVNSYDNKIMEQLYNITIKLENEKREYLHFNMRILTDWIMKLVDNDRNKLNRVIVDIKSIGISIERKKIAKALYLQDTSMRRLILLSSMGIIGNLKAKINIIKGI